MDIPLGRGIIIEEELNQKQTLVETQIMSTYYQLITPTETLSTSYHSSYLCLAIGERSRQIISQVISHPLNQWSINDQG